MSVSAAFTTFFTSSFSRATPEQQKNKAEQSLQKLIADFTEGKNSRRDAKALLKQRSTIDLLEDCKKYGVNLNLHTVNLLQYEAMLKAASADTFLIYAYGELAQVLLQYCDLAEIAQSLIALKNIPFEVLTRFISQRADRYTVLAQLVVTCANQELTLEEEDWAALLTQLLSSKPNPDAAEQEDFKRVIEENGLNLNEITNKAVQNSQFELAIQLLYYGANHEAVFGTQGQFSFNEVIEKMESLVSVPSNQPKENMLRRCLGVAFHTFIMKPTEVPNIIYVKIWLAAEAMSNGLIRAAHSFRA